MPSVGTAYVNIRVNTKGFEAGLDKALARMSTKMKAEGGKMGKAFSDAFQDKSKNMFKGVEEGSQKAATKVVGNLDRVQKKLDDVGLTGSDAGDLIQDGMRRSGEQARSSSMHVQDLSRSLKDAGRNSSRINLGGIGGGNVLRRASRDAGFFRNKLNDLSKMGVGVRRSLAGLHDTVAFMGTALSGAVGGLSSAAQGIFAVGANAAAAAPALAIFANGLLSIMQVGAAVGFSMQGVGAAITAGLDPAVAAAKTAGTSMTGMSDATESAARRVRDAKESLAQAYQSAGRAAADAARRVADAEQTLAQAQMDSLEAQEALNEARHAGREEMEDIAFAAEDAALAERRAGLDLADATVALQAVSGLPVDDRARVEAQLAFEEADLQAREAADRREDAAKDQKDAVKKGLQGTDAMVQAHQDVADAAETEAKAEQDLADARREAAQSAQDSARAIRDAQQGVADAQTDLAQAQAKAADGTDAATTAIDKYKEALAKLSPSQREFVERIIGMQDEYQDFRKAVAEPLFSRLVTAMDGVNKRGKDGSTIMDVLTRGLRGTSKALGDTAIQASTLGQNTIFQRSLSQAMEVNNQAIGNFGKAGVHLVSVFVQLADAASPFFLEFSEWVKKVTQGWNETAKFNNKVRDAKDQVTPLSSAISVAVDHFKEFWNFAKELWRTLKIVGTAASEAADGFGDVNRAGEDAKKNGYIDYLTDKLKQFNDALDNPGKKAEMIERFTVALENMNSAGAALKEAIIDPFLTLGSDKRIGEGFDKIAGGGDTFDRLAATAGEAAPALGDLVIHVADLAAAISESGSMKVFLETVGGVAEVLADIVNKVPPGVLKAIGTALGIMAAVRFVGGIGQKFLAALTPPGLNKIPGTVRKIGPKIETAGASVKRAGTNIAVGFAISFTDGMLAAGTELTTASKGAVRTISNAMGLDEGTKIATDLMRGIVIGLQEAEAGAAVAAGEAATAIIRSFKSAMGVKSPSTMTASAGRDVMRGVALGIEEGLPAAETAAATAGRTVGTTVGTSMKTAAKTSTAGMGATMGTAVSGEVTKAAADPKVAGSVGKFGKVFAGASKVMSGAARGLGGAMNFMMGPWGLLIMILFPLLMPLLEKLNKKFKITEKVMDALSWVVEKLGDMFSWLWDTVLKPFFGWVADNAGKVWGKLSDAAGATADAFQWLWDKIMAVFNWIKDHWPLLLAIITGPIGIAVLLITKNWDTIKAIVQAAVDFVTGILTGIWDGITAGWNAILTFFSTLWSDKLQPFFQGLIDKAQALLNKIWNGIKEGWNAIGDFIRNLWKDRLQPILTNLITNAKNKLVNFFKGIIQGYAAIGIWLANLWKDKVKPKIDSLLESATNKLKTFFDGIKEGWRAIKDWFDGLWDSISGKIDTFVTSFSGAVSGIWDGLKDGFEDVYEAVAKAVNDYLIGGINKVLKFVGAPEINISMDEDIQLAQGGPVVGRGGGKDDKVRARLSHGEYVMPAKAARGIGRPALDVMRRTGKLPMGDPGPFGWVVGKAKDIGGALANGTEFAIKWAIEKLLSNLPDNVIGSIIKGVIENAADAFASWGKDKEPVAAGYGGDVIVPDPSNPAGHMTWQGKTFTNLFYAHLKKALSLAGLSSVTIFQGGFRPTTDYSGTSHAGDAIDTIVNYAWLYALRRVGIASGDRTGLGDWAPHIHAIPGPGAGYAGGSAVWQWSDYIARGGAKQAANSPWGLAMGGVVAPSPMGTLAWIAERGQQERVTPLDREGFTPAERRILEVLESQFTTSGGDTINVHPSQGMDETALADKVARRVAWKRRTGAGWR